MKNSSRVLLSGAVVLVAVAVVGYRYWDYVVNPWTRDGQVRAQVVQIAPRVEGPIVNLAVRDNQFVKAGDLLFEIDPRTYQASLDQASAKLDETRDDLEDLAQQVNAAQAAVSQADSQIKQAESAVISAQATVVKATADFKRAKALVKKGDISRRTFDSTKANYDVDRANLDKAKSALIQAQSARLQTEAELGRAQAELGAEGEDNAQLRGAKAELEKARLDMEFTRVEAPVDGYVTNLNLRLGSTAVANEPALALVDTNSFWVHGFFRENTIAGISEGNRAIITLMSYPDKPLEGIVDSLGWGISQEDGSTGEDLLPTINPTFEWIRLAQRVPVRIHLVNVPDDVKLRVGTTASVLVMTGTQAGESTKSVPPAPQALQ